jgi:hypothetical protein
VQEPGAALLMGLSPLFAHGRPVAMMHGVAHWLGGLLVLSQGG